MKKFLVLCFLIPLFGAAQIYQPALLYGKKENAHAIKRAAFFPTGCGNPVALFTLIDSTINQSASYFDSCAHRYWLYDPKLKAWDSVHVGAASLPYTITNGLTESPAGTVKLGGLLTGETIIEGGSNNYLHYNLGITRFQTTSTTAMHLVSTNATDSSYVDIRTGGPISQKKVVMGSRNISAGTTYLTEVSAGLTGIIDIRTSNVNYTGFISMQDDIILDQTLATGENSRIGMIADSVYINPWLGQLNIDSLRVWNGIADTLYKKPMTWDTRNGRWEYASNWWSGGGGSYTDEEAQDAVGTILVDDNTIDFTYTDATPSITGAVRTQMSITSDASGIKLVADETTPTDGKFYGKVGGAKGWFTPAGGGITIDVTTITGGTDTRILVDEGGLVSEDADLQWYTPDNAFSVGASSGNGSIRSYQTAGFYVGMETIGAKSGIRRSNTDFLLYYNTSTGRTHIDATYSGNPDIYFDIQGVTKMNMNGSGRLFIGGTTSATAGLHHAAGTASANTAPEKFTSGTDLSVNEAGTVQFDGNFSLTKENAVKYGVGGNLTTNTTDVGNVGTGVDNLQSYSVPAGTMSQDGDYIEFSITFTFAENANSKQVRVVYGGTEVYASGAQAQSGGSMTVIGKVIRTGATTQKVTVIAISGAALFVDVSNYTTAGETLSGAVILKGTGEAVSNDDIVQVVTTVKFFPSN